MVKFPRTLNELQQLGYRNHVELYGIGQSDTYDSPTTGDFCMAQVQGPRVICWSNSSWHGNFWFDLRTKSYKTGIRRTQFGFYEE